MDKYSIYTTIAGDTWDRISLKFYNDEFHSTDIIKMNTEHISTLIFTEGVELKIPELNIKQMSTLPPWKRGLRLDETAL